MGYGILRDNKKIDFLKNKKSDPQCIICGNVAINYFQCFYGNSTIEILKGGKPIGKNQVPICEKHINEIDLIRTLVSFIEDKSKKQKLNVCEKIFKNNTYIELLNINEIL